MNEAHQTPFPRITLYMLLLKLQKETVTFQMRLESSFLGHQVCKMSGSVFCLNWGDVIWQKTQNAKKKKNRNEEVIVRRMS